MIQKQLGSPDAKYQRSGVIGAVALANHIGGAGVNNPSRQKQAQDLLDRLFTSCKHNPVRVTVASHHAI